MRRPYDVNVCAFCSGDRTTGVHGPIEGGCVVPLRVAEKAERIASTYNGAPIVGPHDPIAYTFDADIHCPNCTRERFGRCSHGFIACPDDAHDPMTYTDSEGNTVGIIAPWDEIETPVSCGTCSELILEG